MLKSVALALNRIHLDGPVRVVFVGGELNGIIAGYGPRPIGKVDERCMPSGSVMQIPDEAMHAGFVEELQVTHPVHGQFNGVRISLIQLVTLAKRRTSLPAESRLS
jgi:hypothetical protein